MEFAAGLLDLLERVAPGDFHTRDAGGLEVGRGLSGALFMSCSSRRGTNRSIGIVFVGVVLDGIEVVTVFIGFAMR